MKLLVVDDHEVVREGMRWMLESVPGIEVTAEASNPESALTVLDAVQVDVILLDLKLGDESGFTVLEKLKGRPAAPPVVVVSMFDNRSHVQRALSLGAAGYLPKRSGISEIVFAIKQAVAGETYVAPALDPGDPEPWRMDPSLTPREQQILQLVADGYQNKQIARELGITEGTVKSYLRDLFARWGVNSRSEAVTVALRLGHIA